MGCFRLPSVPRRADCCLSGWAASIAAASPRLPYCSARGLASLPLRQRQQLCSRRQQAAPGRCRAPQPCQAAAGPAAAAAPAAGSSFWSGLVQAWSSNPAAVLLAGAACLLGLSLSVFLLSAIPTMLVRPQGIREPWGMLCSNVCWCAICLSSPALVSSASSQCLQQSPTPVPVLCLPRPSGAAQPQQRRC